MTMNRAITITPSLVQRFWPKVEITEACWLWRGAKCRGYGAINTGKMGQNYTAHRVSWVMANGPIPDGLHVLHRCDTPACVRPDHLFLGTDADNHTDKAKKGRAPSHTEAVIWGERHHWARLTENDVRAIRMRAATGEKQVVLAKEYDLDQSTVSNIVTRKNWKHVK